MKFIVFAALCTAVAFATPRNKRQLSISSISVQGAGGATGCVVTGNVLYANGIALRNLTSAEQQELTTYQSEVETYKTQLRDILNQRRDNLRGRLLGQRGRGQQQQQQQQQSNSIDATSSSSSSSSSGNDTLPTAPQKPSFCTAQETTQYYFDGCMVQNNKVYVGGQYARDLTSSEQSELQTFDTEQTAYQNAVQQQMQSQVRGLFGGQDFFSALFGEDSSSGSSSQQSTTVAPTGTTTLPPKPSVPNFCTAIY